MLSQETVTILKALERLETGLSKVYNHLAEKGHFAGPVRKFWATIRDEEIMHAKAFNEIREKAQADQTFELTVQFDMGTLQDFVEKVNALLDKVKKENITESEAYTLAALIEAELQ
jgi:rubrerythrin